MRRMVAGMKSYAQAGQDAWVIDQFGDGPGYFVDVGAHDGIVHSNTYALEHDYGWRGLCIEPNTEARKQCVFNRNTVILRYAVSDTIGTIPFDGVHVGVGEPVECRTLANLLDLYDAPPVIDYLSIDVEGHELAVLDGMDFNRWQVRLLTIEHNLYCDGPVRKDAIFDHLTARGFERVVEDIVAPGYGCYEDWYRGE